MHELGDDDIQTHFQDGGTGPEVEEEEEEEEGDGGNDGDGAPARSDAASNGRDGGDEGAFLRRRLRAPEEGMSESA